MSEMQKAREIMEAMVTQRAATNALSQLKTKDIIINRASLAAEANTLIDLRDSAQRKVEESLGAVSAETRKLIVQTFNDANPKDEFGKQIAEYVRRVDGE